MRKYLVTVYVKEKYPALVYTVVLPNTASRMILLFLWNANLWIRHPPLFSHNETEKLYLGSNIQTWMHQKHTPHQRAVEVPLMALNATLTTKCDQVGLHITTNKKTQMRVNMRIQTGLFEQVKGRTLRAENARCSMSGPDTGFNVRCNITHQVLPWP